MHIVSHCLAPICAFKGYGDGKRSPSSTFKPCTNLSSCLDAPKAGTSMQWPKRTKRSGSGFLDSAGASYLWKGWKGDMFSGICLVSWHQTMFQQPFPKKVPQNQNVLSSRFETKTINPKRTLVPNTKSSHQCFRHRSGNHGVRNGAARGESNDSWACPVPTAARRLRLFRPWLAFLTASPA